MNPSTFERLRQLHADLSATHAYPWNNMEVWIATARPFVRTALSEHLEDFERLAAPPHWASLPRVYSTGVQLDGTPPRNNLAEVFAKEKKINMGLSEETKEKLLAWLDGVITLPAEEPNSPPVEPLVRVRNILDRIPAVVRVLSKRRKGTGEPLVLTDEYDLQYLLHDLLAVEFQGVEPEEWTPSHAGSSSRIDFLLKREKIGIETKYVRSNHNNRKIADELIIDKERYHAAHPECDTLLCFVYDPNRLLQNPEALQNDLSSDYPLTEVYVRPL